MRKSLRTRLIIWIGSAFAISILAYGAILVQLSSNAAYRLLDETLMSQARNMGRGPMPGDRPGGENRPPPFNERREQVGQTPRRNGPMFISVDGIVRMPRGATSPMSARLFEESRMGRPGATTIRLDGKLFRVASVPVRREQRIVGVFQVTQELDQLHLATQAQISSLLLAIPFVIAVAAVIGWLLSRVILAPIERLTLAADRISRDPKAQARIESTSEDEIGHLSQTFNRMTDRLQGSNADLQASLERQQQFTSDASHELRTPLTRMMLAAENGLHPAATADDMRASLSTVKRSADAMQGLTEYLLVQARLDGGTVETHLGWHSLEPIIDSARETVGLPLGERFVLDLSSEFLWLDPEATHQILVNLLENANRYTPEGGTITVTAMGNHIDVIDTGPGIAPEHLEHLFDRFYRADAARERGKGGFGLGLAISQSLARAMGGELSVTSELGKGSAFRLELPEAPDSEK